MASRHVDAEVRVTRWGQANGAHIRDAFREYDPESTGLIDRTHVEALLRVAARPSLGDLEIKRLRQLLDSATDLASLAVNYERLIDWLYDPELLIPRPPTEPFVRHRKRRNSFPPSPCYEPLKCHVEKTSNLAHMDGLEEQPRTNIDRELIPAHKIRRPQTADFTTKQARQVVGNILEFGSNALPPFQVGKRPRTADLLHATTSRLQATNQRLEHITIAKDRHDIEMMEPPGSASFTQATQNDCLEYGSSCAAGLSGNASGEANFGTTPSRQLSAPVSVETSYVAAALSQEDHASKETSKPQTTVSHVLTSSSFIFKDTDGDVSILTVAGIGLGMHWFVERFGLASVDEIRISARDAPLEQFCLSGPFGTATLLEPPPGEMQRNAVAAMANAAEKAGVHIVVEGGSSARVALHLPSEAPHFDGSASKTDTAVQIPFGRAAEPADEHALPSGDLPTEAMQPCACGPDEVVFVDKEGDVSTISKKRHSSGDVLEWRVSRFGVYRVGTLHILCHRDGETEQYSIIGPCGVATIVDPSEGPCLRESVEKLTRIAEACNVPVCHSCREPPPATSGGGVVSEASRVNNYEQKVNMRDARAFDLDSTSQSTIDPHWVNGTPSLGAPSDGFNSQHALSLHRDESSSLGYYAVLDHDVPVPKSTTSSRSHESPSDREAPFPMPPSVTTSGLSINYTDNKNDATAISSHMEAAAAVELETCARSLMTVAMTSRPEEITISDANCAGIDDDVAILIATKEVLQVGAAATPADHAENATSPLEGCRSNGCVAMGDVTAPSDNAAAAEITFIQDDMHVTDKPLNSPHNLGVRTFVDEAVANVMSTVAEAAAASIINEHNEELVEYIEIAGQNDLDAHVAIVLNAASGVGSTRMTPQVVAPPSRVQGTAAFHRKRQQFAVVDTIKSTGKIAASALDEMDALGLKKEEEIDTQSRLGSNAMLIADEVISEEELRLRMENEDRRKFVEPVQCREELEDITKLAHAPRGNAEEEASGHRPLLVEQTNAHESRLKVELCRKAKSVLHAHAKAWEESCTAHEMIRMSAEDQEHAQRQARRKALLKASAEADARVKAEEKYRLNAVDHAMRQEVSNVFAEAEHELRSNAKESVRLKVEEDAWRQQVSKAQQASYYEARLADTYIPPKDDDQPHEEPDVQQNSCCDSIFKVQKVCQNEMAMLVAPLQAEDDEHTRSQEEIQCALEEVRRQKDVESEPTAECESVLQLETDTCKEAHTKMYNDARLKTEEESALATKETVHQDKTESEQNVACEFRVHAEGACPERHQSLESRTKTKEGTCLKAEEDVRLQAEEEALPQEVSGADMETCQGTWITVEEEERTIQRHKAEEEFRRHAEAEARQQKILSSQSEAEKVLRLRVEADRRLQEEEQAWRRNASKVHAEAENEAKLREEEEMRLKAQEEIRIKIEEKETQIQKEQEKRVKIDNEARLRAVCRKARAILETYATKEEARLKAEERARIKAEDDARLQEELDARQKAVYDRKLITKAVLEAHTEATEEVRHRAEEVIRLNVVEETWHQTVLDTHAKAQEVARVTVEQEIRSRIEQNTVCQKLLEARQRAEYEAHLKAEEVCRRARTALEARADAEEAALCRGEYMIRLKVKEELWHQRAREVHTEAEAVAQLRAAEKHKSMLVEDARCNKMFDALRQVNAEVRLKAEQTVCRRAMKALEAHTDAEEDARVEAEQHALSKVVEEDRRRKMVQSRAEAEEEVRLKATEELRQKIDDEMWRQKESEARQKAEHEARLKAEKVCRRARNILQAHAEAMEEAQFRAVEQLRIKIVEEERLKANDEIRLKLDEDMWHQKELEARQQAEHEACLKAEEACRRARLMLEVHAEATEEAQFRAEERTRMTVEEEARLKAKEDIRLKVDEEIWRLKELEARQQAKHEVRLKTEEVCHRARIMFEAHAKATEMAHFRAEEQLRTTVEEEARCRMAFAAQSDAEEDARLKSEAEIRLTAEGEAFRQKTLEAHTTAEDEARFTATEETRLNVEAELRRQKVLSANSEAEHVARLTAEAEVRAEVEDEAWHRRVSEAHRESEEEARMRAAEAVRLEVEEINAALKGAVMAGDQGACGNLLELRADVNITSQERELRLSILKSSCESIAQSSLRPTSLAYTPSRHESIVVGVPAALVAKHRTKNSRFSAEIEIVPANSETVKDTAGILWAVEGGLKPCGQLPGRMSPNGVLPVDLQKIVCPELPIGAFLDEAGALEIWCCQADGAQPVCVGSHQCSLPLASSDHDNVVLATAVDFDRGEILFNVHGNWAASINVPLGWLSSKVLYPAAFATRETGINFVMEGTMTNTVPPGDSFSPALCKTEGDPLFLCAASSNQWEIVETMVKKRFAQLPAAIREEQLAKRGSNGWTLLHYACAAGKTALIQELLELGASGCIYDGDGHLPVDIALQHSHRAAAIISGSVVPWHECSSFAQAVLPVMLQAPGEEASLPAATLTTALRAAAARGCAPLSKLLLDLSADADAEHTDSTTALLAASKSGHAGVVNILLEQRATVNAISKSGRTPLLLACQYGHELVVDSLLNHGAMLKLDVSPQCIALSPVVIASQNGHSSIVERLLRIQASPDAAAEDGWTSLHLASQGGHERVVGVLLEARASVCAATPSGWSALHIVAQNGDKIIAKHLLDHRAAVDVAHAEGALPLHLAVQHKHEAVSQLLIERGAPVNRCMDGGATALHTACQNASLFIVRVLLVSNASVDARMQGDVAAIHMAAQSGSGQILRLLLDHGAAMDAKMRGGYSPLVLSARGGHEESVRMLLEKRAAPDLRTQSGWTALLFASQGGFAAIAELLLSRGSKADKCTPHGRTPLHVASQNGHVSVIGVLLERSAKVDMAMPGGWTALHLASQNSHENVVRALVAAGVNVDTATNSGCNALHMAAEQGRESVVGLLLGAKASLDIRQDKGATALHLATQNNHCSVARLLLESQAAVNAPADGGATALHMACQGGCDVMAHLLMDSGATLTVVMDGGYTPLHVASKQGHQIVVQLLLARGADANEQVKIDGWSALMLAARNGHSGVVQSLLQDGASANAQMRNAQTALHFACQYGHVEVVQTLLAEGNADPSPVVQASLHPHYSSLGSDSSVDASSSRSYAALPPAALARNYGHEAIAALMFEHMKRQKKTRLG